MSSSTGAATGRPTGAGSLLAAIHDALDALSAEVLGGAVGDGELVSSVEALHRAETRALAEKLRRVAEIDRRRAYSSQGSRSTVDLLVRRLGLTRGEARRQADTAVKLERLPETAARFRRGELGAGQAEIAARMLDELTFDDDESGPAAAGHDGDGGGGHDGDAGAGGEANNGAGAGGAETAADGDGGSPVGEHDGDGGDGGGPGGRGGGSGLEKFDKFVAREGAEKDRNQLRRGINEWQHDQDPDWLADRDKALHARRGAWLHNNPDGSVRLHARLDPLAGARVRAALDALSRPADGNDPRTFEQRQADALTELADRYLADADRPETTASRPQVLLITPVPGADEQPTPPATLDGYGPVSAATAAQAGCDADTTTVTIRNGDILDAGRARRAPSRAQRAAVIARDRHCVGCQAPISRCDIHHIRPWARGGGTDLANLVAVCWTCHHHLHHHNWRVRRRPDGAFTLQPPEPAHDRRPPTGHPRHGEHARRAG